MTNTDFVRETIDLINQIETRFIELGARLYRIREEKLWQSTYQSYQEFLDAAKISPGNASILASIHKHYVVDGGLNEDKLRGAGYSNLYEAIPLIEREGVGNALTKAHTLTRSEIKEEVREQKHGEHHHIIGTERWGLCSVCHKFERINEETN